MKAKDIALVAMMLSLLIVSGMITIPIGPVPITLATVMVALIGMTLEPKLAGLTLVLYTIVKLIQFSSLLSPSFGYIIGWIFAAYFQARYLQGKNEPTIGQYAWSCVINYVWTYIFGLIYFVIIYNLYLGHDAGLWVVLGMTTFPFFIGDIIKYTAAIGIAKVLRPRIQKQFQA